MSGSGQGTFCATLVDEWLRAGVAHAVVSPGSRSTPLALALAARPELGLHVVLDERSAAFVALGLAKASCQPVVLLCTSGTAAANHLPAVVEAGLSGVPLLVCTADRPPDLHDVGAPQTIRQVGLFGQHVRWAVDVDPVAWPQAAWRSLASRAVLEAAAGPVHLDLRFRDPLVEEPGALPEPRPGGGAWHASPAPSVAATPSLAGLASSRRGAVVAGEGCAGPAPAEGPWPVVADPASGWRVPGPATVAAADAVLRAAADDPALRPDLVVRLGRPPASKVLATWLDGLDVPQVVADPRGRWLDPSRRADLALTAATRQVVGALDAGAADPAFLAGWARAEQVAQGAIDEVLAGHEEVTEPGLARDLVRHLPDGSALVVSSSMPIRDVEWFGGARTGLDVLANRGANGIDGVTSTALGVALARAPRPTACLLGDLALLHDGSGLTGLATRRVALALVVVDNQGGGIFSFLPQAQQLPPERFEQLFGTPQPVDLHGLAAAHGLASVEVEGASDLAWCLAEATAVGGVRLLIARTDRRRNVEVHRELEAAVAAALGRA